MIRALSNRIYSAFHEPHTRIYRYVQGSIWALIVVTIVILVAEALLPDGSVQLGWLRGFDRVLLSIFAVEILLRVGSYRPAALKVFDRPPIGRIRTHVMARIGYLVRPLTLVDILAVLAWFPELRGLRALRLLRLLRTTRVFRYRNPFAIVIRAFEENSLLFTLAFGVLGVTTFLGGISIYLVELKVNPDINSPLDGIWWGAGDHHHGRLW